MKDDAKKGSKKVSITVEKELLSEMQGLADARFGGNLSAAFNHAVRTELELGRGPMSKIFQFSSEIAAILRNAGLKVTNTEHAVDWVLPLLNLGIESKTRFTAGKAESATVAAMAYTVGQRLCSEIWIVGSDAMSADDRKQWDRVAREFHLCPVRFIFASMLEHELRLRMEKPALAVAEDQAPYDAGPQPEKEGQGVAVTCGRLSAHDSHEPKRRGYHRNGKRIAPL